MYYFILFKGGRSENYPDPLGPRTAHRLCAKNNSYSYYKTWEH